MRAGAPARIEGAGDDVLAAFRWVQAAAATG